jgi:hypothetical protein
MQKIFRWSEWDYSDSDWSEWDYSDSGWSEWDYSDSGWSEWDYSDSGWSETSEDKLDSGKSPLESDWFRH